MIVPNSIPRPLVRTNQWFIVLSVLAAWLSHEYWILALPLVAGIGGLAFNFNPIVRGAKLFLKKPMASYIPEDRDQQQFNQWISVILLFVGVLSYTFHFPIIGYVASAMVFVAAFVAICGFCIGCFIRFQWLRYRQRRHAR